MNRNRKNSFALVPLKFKSNSRNAFPGLKYRRCLELEFKAYVPFDSDNAPVSLIGPLMAYSQKKRK